MSLSLLHQLKETYPDFARFNLNTFFGGFNTKSMLHDKVDVWGGYPKFESARARAESTTEPQESLLPGHAVGSVDKIVLLASAPHHAWRLPGWHVLKTKQGETEYLNPDGATTWVSPIPRIQFFRKINKYIEILKANNRKWSGIISMKTPNNFWDIIQKTEIAKISAGKSPIITDQMPHALETQELALGIPLPTSVVYGGHALMVNKIQDEGDYTYITMKNSWGEDTGTEGHHCFRCDVIYPFIDYLAILDIPENEYLDYPLPLPFKRKDFKNLVSELMGDNNTIDFDDFLTVLQEIGNDTIPTNGTELMGKRIPIDTYIPLEKTLPVGGNAECKNKLHDEWEKGKVTSVNPLEINGFFWNYVRPGKE